MATNSSVIAGALPELVAAEARLYALAKAHGMDYRIADFGGLRTLADTVRILKYRDDDYANYVKAYQHARASGASSFVSDGTRYRVGSVPLNINTFRAIAPFGHSYHNYGAAFDVQMIRGNLSDLHSLAANNPSIGLRGIPNDPPHFELARSLNVVKLLWEKYHPVQAAAVQAETAAQNAVSTAGVAASEAAQGAQSAVKQGVELAKANPVTAAGVIAIIALALVAVNRRWFN